MRKKGIFFFIAALFIVVANSISIYAITTITSSRGKIKETSTSVSISTAYTSSTNSFS